MTDWAVPDRDILRRVIFQLQLLGDILTEAPASLTERLLDVFDMQAVYNRDKNQVTIHATVTDATPQAIKDLLADPRADHHTPLPSQPGTTSQDHVGHLARHTGVAPRANTVGEVPARGREAHSGGSGGSPPGQHWPRAVRRHRRFPGPGCLGR